MSEEQTKDVKTEQYADYDVRVEGASLYVLNENGENFLTALIQPGRTNEDTRTPDETLVAFTDRLVKCYDAFAGIDPSDPRVVEALARLRNGKPATDSPSNAVGDVNAGLREALTWIGHFDDDSLRNAATLHWDMRDKARAALAASESVTPTKADPGIDEIVRKLEETFRYLPSESYAWLVIIEARASLLASKQSYVPAALEGRDPAKVMAVFNAAMAMPAKRDAFVIAMRSDDKRDDDVRGYDAAWKCLVEAVAAARHA